MMGHFGLRWLSEAVLSIDILWGVTEMQLELDSDICSDNAGLSCRA